MKLKLIFIFLLYLGNLTLAQSENKNDSLRNGYFYFSIGIADLFGLGTGIQLNEKSSLGVKYSMYWLKGGVMGDFAPNNGGGFGLKYSYKVDDFIFDMFNVEITLLNVVADQRFDYPLIKGVVYDINIGNYKISEFGFNIFYGFGIAICTATHIPPLIMPNAKLGFNLNF